MFNSVHKITTKTLFYKIYIETTDKKIGPFLLYFEDKFHSSTLTVNIGR